MTVAKRIMDIVLVLLMSVFLVPVMIGIAVVILWRNGRPVFYVSERMKALDQGFNLWKFRTMESDASDSGASGGHKAARITPTGRALRRSRMDELPQLWNILRGDISFVGPRPPLRCYVEQFPDIYRAILAARPGVTGLATLVYHKTEETLLADCSTAAQNEAVYIARCIPKKAEIDILYARNQSVCFDLWLILSTMFRAWPVRRKSSSSTQNPHK